MDLQLLLVKSVRRARRVGLVSALREGSRLLRPKQTWDDEFDLKYGTDTRGLIKLWNFKVDSPNARFGVGYQTMDESAIIDAIGALPEGPHDLTFIDIGCGKGKALLVAANLGFKRVIGVEFVHELAEIARLNLRKMGVSNAEVVETDAAKYRFPSGDIVVYLFNPFQQEVMQQVIANLRESAARKLYVIYAGPACAALLDSSGFLNRLNCPPGRPYIQLWSAPSAR